MAKSKFLKWRAKRKRGSIMKPSTFKKIVRAAKGARSPAAVAGAAYWKTAHAKFRKRKK